MIQLETGEVIRILENGKPCPDVFGVGLNIESKFGDGTPFAQNTVGFSFIMTRSLLSLKQNSKATVTIGAEVEAQYSDDSTTTKRMFLATNSDKSTFSTSPIVQDSGNESSSMKLFISFFLLAIALFY